MSNGKSNADDLKSAPVSNKPQPARSAAETLSLSGKQPPLFRPTDWLAFGITTLLVFIGYFLTLAPNLTLEDSGELAVGSFYAGIPHPPGYPVWTLYTWVFSHLVPISNIAYRVALASAVAGALACGLLALIVSRGSSMMIEGISDLKNMDRRWENVICLVSGFVCGILMGFNGYMWSQSIIVEVYSISMLSLAAVLVFMLRWIYAPEQRRYLYLAFFIFGICVTNHQTLILMAIGLEVAIIAAQPKLGRDLLLGNSIVYITGLVLKQQHILTGMDGNDAVFVLYNCIGVISIIACAVYAVRTQQIGTEWKVVAICGVMWLVGAGFYFWMPIAGMSNPPMQWGYPRTVEGFFHALSRGQYEKTQPSDVIGDPFRYFGQLTILGEGVVSEFNWIFTLIALVPFFFFLRMQKRERNWMICLFAIYCCMGFFLLALLNPTHDRQALEIGRVQFTASHVLVAILVGYGVTLILALMATHYERFRRWGIMGGIIAAVLALYSLANTTQTLFGDAQGGGANSLFQIVGDAFAKDRYTLPIVAGLLLVALVVVYIVTLAIFRTKPMMAIALVIFAIMPFHSVMNHWFENEQRGHLFGYWFGHDMFTPPFIGPDGKFSYDAKVRSEMLKDPEKARAIYPEMARDAVLYGGTDPGRFCPTYTIFCESFIPPSKKLDTDPNYDRRDVYIITQNALADGTYLMYIRAHYNRSAQLQYDLPFFQELCRGSKEKELNYKTNLIARMVSPLDKLFGGIGKRIERERRAGSSVFTPKDFTDLAGFVAKLKKHDPEDPLSAYLFDNLSKKTLQLLNETGNESALRSALAADLNVLLERELLNTERVAELQAEEERLEPDFSEKDKKRKDVIDGEIAELRKQGRLYDAERFKNVKLPESTVKFIAQNPLSDTRIRLNRLLLEAAYPGEIGVSKGGVYPDREIYIATPDDSQKCFRDYMEDAQRRLQIGQLKPGENVRVVDSRVQVSGQVAVMAINGLLTKVMFDANPDHEFYVEESFPLDWMYPYLTPFGIIMKINRQPLDQLPEDVLYRDHQFWSDYSQRLIGNWITYDTSVKEICDFAEKTYLRHDFRGFTGDPKFVRDDQAQKAFSKLRSSIGGIYAWRINEAGRKGNPVEQQRMIKEADFTFKQAFALCPYSPEAVFRYVQVLANIGRIDDALLIAKTCFKFDPENGQISSLIDNLTDAAEHGYGSSPNSLEKMEARYRSNPEDFQTALNLAAVNYQRGYSNRSIEILEKLVNNPKADRALIVAVAQMYIQLSNFPKLEAALQRLVKMTPDQAEAWYDLASVQASLGKITEAIPSLTRAMELNDRALNQPRNLHLEAAKDPRFESVRGLSEFQKLVSPKAE